MGAQRTARNFLRELMYDKKSGAVRDNELRFAKREVRKIKSLSRRARRRLRWIRRQRG
jgi:hypothetical protein